MINFRQITEENFNAVIALKRPEGERFVAPNAVSLAQAWLYREANDVFPFAVYHGNTLVGFVILDADEEERCLALWRIMFPEEHANKGYGTQTVRRIIELARESGKFDCVILTHKPENAIAKHVYEKIGFRPTGVISNGEIELKYDL